jgi:hypothetical protein
MVASFFNFEFVPNQRPNRTGFYRFEFGSVRLRFLESSSGSVRFGCISKTPVRVRFGSFSVSDSDDAIEIDEREIEESVDAIKIVRRIK